MVEMAPSEQKNESSDEPKSLMNAPEGLENLVQDPRATSDLSAETASVLAQAEQLKNAGKLEDAIAAIVPMEKKARNAFDGLSGSKLCCAALNVYFDAGDVEKALQVLQTLCRKRLQLKRSITAMVETCMQQKAKIGSKESELKIIEVLTAVTEGKIFVEVQRARLLFDLAKMKEAEGDIEKAAALLQEVQVENITAMDRAEKAELVLQQMRLVLEREDYIRCQIISQKIPQKTLAAPEFQHERLRYYSYMVTYNLHEEQMGEVCKCLAKLLDTPIVRQCQTKPEGLKKDELAPFLPENFDMANLNLWYCEAYVLFLVLSARDPEQVNQCRVFQQTDKKLLQRTPVFNRLLEEFINTKVIRFSAEDFKALEAHPLFQEKRPFRGAEARMKSLKQKMIQHDLCVIAKYYTRANLNRISELISVDQETVETELCNLVSNDTVIAKIDRATGQVVFGAQQNPAALLTEWTLNTAKLLSSVEKVSHILENERTVHAMCQSRGLPV